MGANVNMKNGVIRFSLKFKKIAEIEHFCLANIVKVISARYW